VGKIPKILTAEASGVSIDGAPRPTEDRLVVLDNAVIVLDGATSLCPDLPTGGWYATKLAAALSRHITPDLKTTLANAIHQVAADHALKPGDSPSSTVAMVYWTPTEIHALVLADSPIVAFTTHGIELLEDTRLAALGNPAGGYRARLSAGKGYGPDHIKALQVGGQFMSTLRNVPNGFWIAEANPQAAAHAFTATWARHEVDEVLIATDGVSCAVADYNLYTWHELREVATEEGPEAVLAKIREAERADPDGKRWPRPKIHDDQALAVITFSAGEAAGRPCSSDPRATSDGNARPRRIVTDHGERQEIRLPTRGSADQRWPGTGSNRRPSAFQADARTN
jgi:hypothetical protein